MTLRDFGRTLLLLALLGVAVFVGGRLLTLYTGPWVSFIHPTREFLAAAAAHDSIRLRHLATSDAVVRRTLAAAEQRPAQVGIDHLRIISGRRTGDTTRVVFFHTGCSGNILALTFRGSGSRARIEDITLPCGTP